MYSLVRANTSSEVNGFAGNEESATLRRSLIGLLQLETGLKFLWSAGEYLRVEDPC